MQKLTVLFRANRSGAFKGDVTAVFPSLVEGRGLVACYAHIGQHSACCLEWYRGTRPAAPTEYADLHQELTDIYTAQPSYGEPVELVVGKRWTHRFGAVA